MHPRWPTVSNAQKLPNAPHSPRPTKYPVGQIPRMQEVTAARSVRCNLKKATIPEEISARFRRLPIAHKTAAGSTIAAPPACADRSQPRNSHQRQQQPESSQPRRFAHIQLRRLHKIRTRRQHIPLRRIHRRRLLADRPRRIRPVGKLQRIAVHRRVVTNPQHRPCRSQQNKFHDCCFRSRNYKC